jgi:hypothetical protein
LTFDLTLSALPLAGCAFATAFGAAVLALARVAAGLVAVFLAAAGFSVSAIKMTPFEQLGAKEMVLLPTNICIAGALVNYSTGNLVLKSICRSIVAKTRSRG